MKLGIIGTGNIGIALGKALTKKGFRVMFGSRSVAKANQAAGEMEHNADGGTIANAVHFGEIVFLAVPYKSIEEVLRNSDSFNGKIVVDCTNPVIFGEYPELAIGHTTSAAEQIAKMIPEAKVVKAFNTAFSNHIANGPYFGPNDGSMFFCGDDAQAKAAVAKVIEATGFEPVDCGPLSSARMLEPMAVLIIRLGNNMGMGNEIAFKLLTRE
ncbi:MAG: NAD(P)-binding domain-containing protein [Bacteroidetes bacterium]|nr:NAD(P)-binding domain-containing protein [Bacteroidota bacterium]